MHCNIDAKGKALRLAAGSALLLLATSSAVAWFRTDELGFGVGAIAGAVAGAFMTFEGAAGWCVLRALGFRTPI